MQQLGKGADLERRIEAFFRLNGYETTRNVVKEGRSGAPHEIDVLAVKSDGVTDFTVLVECKAWGMPIAKEVVSKVSMILGDLGMHKAIIVSLKGWSTGADLTAQQLGIELWGTEEIQNKLGQVAVAELEIGPSNLTGRGFEVAIPEPTATSRLLATARGFLGFGREEVVWIKLLWIPFLLLELDHSKTRATFLKGPVTETTTRWSLYEALSGTFFQTFDSPPSLAVVVVGQSVPARAQPRRIQREVNDTIKKARSVVTQRAQQRYAERLRELGIPEDSEATAISRAEQIQIPMYLGLFRSGDRHRFVAIDAVWGKNLAAIDAALTENRSYIIEVVGDTEIPGSVPLPPTAGLPTARGLVVLAVVGLLEYLIVGRESGTFTLAFTVTIAGFLVISLLMWWSEQA